VVLGIDLRTSPLLSVELRCSTLETHPPARFALVTLELHFMSWPVWTAILLFVFPYVAMCHRAHPLVEMGSHILFAQADLKLQSS
jgi:hypothetical protein